MQATLPQSPGIANLIKILVCYLCTLPVAYGSQKDKLKF